MNRFEPIYDNTEALSVDEQEHLNSVTDKSFQKLVETLQGAVVHLTNSTRTALV